MREHKYKIWIPYAKIMIQPKSIQHFHESILKGITIGQLKQWVYLQYTGLKDKNGTPIYEGDIIQVDNHIPEDGEDESFDIITKCEWNGFMYTLQDRAFGCWTRQLRHQPERLKIIGNLYETPELIENR